MFFDPKELRRAQTQDVRNILFAAPKHAWTPPEGALEGTDFEIHSRLELERLSRAFPAQFRGLADTIPPRLDRRVRVRSAGDYTRTDDITDPDAGVAGAFALEHRERGAVYVDVRDKTYLHLSSEQLPVAGLPAALREKPPKWQLVAQENGITISARGPVSLDVVIEHAAGAKAMPDAAGRILAACLPGVEGLVELGLPLAQIAASGVPATLETWLVGIDGRRSAQLARHRVSALTIGAIDPALLSIPQDYRNLRDGQKPGEPAWHALKHPHRRMRRARTARSRKARTARYQATVGQWVPPKFEAATEPVFPECLPSTLQVSSALEIRQALLDAILFLVNTMTRRLDAAAGNRVDPNDPDNTDVALGIDWLDQLERFHRDRGEPGDGLFCLLRDPPPDDDPTGGGEGLLDRMAETLARELVAAEEPIPLGGDDDPVTLPQAIEDEIAGLVADASVPASERFDLLSAASQATVREAVLDQRIARIDYLFDGDFGERLWPHEDYDLVHVKLQLERLALEFVDGDAIRKLVIALEDGDSNKPRIDFEFALARFDATVAMDRWPGVWFWVTATGVLVALAIVGPLAVTGLVLTLIGLGPIGWLVLLMLISQAPVATVAGGAVLLAAVTYLVWDATELRLTLQQPVLRSRLEPDSADDPEEVVLEPDSVSLEGDIAVSVNSEIPSGIHQLFDAIVNLAVVHFDAQVREILESVLMDGLRSALRRLPHFRLPPPFDVEIPVAVAGAPVDHIDVDTPKHELVETGANGVSQWLLSAGAVTRMEFPYPGFAPQRTEVDRDLREKLTERIDRLEAENSAPCLGYGISQNLLNGIVYAQWLAGRFARDYDGAQVDEAFAVLIAACPECAGLSEREVHVWAAAAPTVAVTARAYIEQEARPYLSVCFPDIRVCIGGVAGKASTLELQCAVESVAHLALGGLGSGDVRTLFSLERDFVHVLFDDRREFVRVSPLGRQGLETRGPGFDVVAAFDDAQLVQLLDALAPLLETAARRLLRRNDVAQLTFLPDTPRVDQQLYDGVALADIAPRRASLLVVIRTSGTMALALPRFDQDGHRVYEGIDFDALDCAGGADLRGG